MYTGDRDTLMQIPRPCLLNVTHRQVDIWLGGEGGHRLIFLLRHHCRLHSTRCCQWGRTRSKGHTTRLRMLRSVWKLQTFSRSYNFGSIRPCTINASCFRQVLVKINQFFLNIGAYLCIKDAYLGIQLNFPYPVWVTISLGIVLARELKCWYDCLQSVRKSLLLFENFDHRCKASRRLIFLYRGRRS